MQKFHAKQSCAIVSGWCCTFAWCRVSCTVGALVVHEVYQVEEVCDWSDDRNVAESCTLISGLVAENSIGGGYATRRS
jgi:hypothetical protein